MKYICLGYYDKAKFGSIAESVGETPLECQDMNLTRHRSLWK